MLVIEYRWRCDFEPCKAISPVLRTDVEIGKIGMDVIDVPPVGWVRIEDEEKGKHHFCSAAHHELWELAQEL